MKKSLVVLTVFVGLVAAATVGYVVYWYSSQKKQEPIETQVAMPVEQNMPVNEQKKSSEETDENAKEFDAKALQNSIDTWDKNHKGTASVVIMSTDGKILASLNKDIQYFTASIYKLYVAYEGYREVDAGSVNANEVYQAGRTRGKCLDVMIRNSDSPCAEKMWNELGKDTLTETVQSYGLTNTNLEGLGTTAYDAAQMLQRIATGTGLSEASHEAFMNSMKEQIYRDSLNKGFSKNIVVYNKIGFNGTQEYHDTAIIELEDGRMLIVSVLTSGVGTQSIAQLAEQLEKTF